MNQPKIEFQPIGAKGSNGSTNHFNVIINGIAIGTFEWILHLGKSGNKPIGLVYSRYAGPPAIVPNLNEALKWLFALERESEENKAIANGLATNSIR